MGSMPGTTVPWYSPLAEVCVQETSRPGGGVLALVMRAIIKKYIAASRATNSTPPRATSRQPRSSPRGWVVVEGVKTPASFCAFIVVHPFFVIDGRIAGQVWDYVGDNMS